MNFLVAGAAWRFGGESDEVVVARQLDIRRGLAGPGLSTHEVLIHARSAGLCWRRACTALRRLQSSGYIDRLQVRRNGKLRSSWIWRVR